METVAADAEARDGELLPAGLHSLRMIDYFQAQHLHQPMWLLLRCSHSDVAFKYLDRHHLAYLLNAGLCQRGRLPSSSSNYVFLFFFFFISQHNEMDVSLRASQLLSVQDAGKSLRNRVITCHQSGAALQSAEEIKCAPLVLLYIVRQTKSTKKNGDAMLAGENAHEYQRILFYPDGSSKNCMMGRSQEAATDRL